MTRSAKWLVYTTHLVLALIVLFPLLFALVSSFRPLDDIFKYVSPVTWKTFVPTAITLDAYTGLFQLRNFGRVLFNTVYISVITVLFGVFINSMAAFAFAKFRFKAKNLLFFIVLLTFMIPFEVIAIPLYTLVDKLGWIDSYYGLVVPAIANGFVIFLYRQFFLDLPDALIESARMDGAPWWKIYWRIVMPLCKPVTISAGLIIFIYQWESFMWPLIVTRSEDYRVIQVMISLFTTEHATLWNEMFATAILAIIIPSVLILFFQRYFIQGITHSGSKED